jgi:hypothetical protein
LWCTGGDHLKSLALIERPTEHEHEDEDMKRAKNDVKTKVLGQIKRGYVGI